MLILAAADVHGYRTVSEWLLSEARAAGVDAIVLAGDLLGCPDGFATPEDAQRHDARSLVARLEDAGLPVLYVMGNDDLVEVAPRQPRPARPRGMPSS
jgi:Icc-related predicted phosphoesterase